MTSSNTIRSEVTGDVLQKYSSENRPLLLYGLESWVIVGRERHTKDALIVVVIWKSKHDEFESRKTPTGVPSSGVGNGHRALGVEYESRRTVDNYRLPRFELDWKGTDGLLRSLV